MAHDPDARAAELKKKTRNELLDIARDYAVKGRHVMPKPALVSAVINEENARGKIAPSAGKPHRAAEEHAPERVSPEERRRTGKPKTEAEEIELAQEEAEQSKFVLGEVPPHEEFPLPRGKDLPEHYNEDRLALMIRDPHWAYAYWEITSETLTRVQDQLGEQAGQSRRVLRVYDVTNGRQEHCFDVDLHEGAKNWYINVGKPGAAFCAELGLRTPSGEFYPLVRSNNINMPPITMSEVVDEHWMSLKEEYERMYALSGGFQQGTSSMEIREIIERRLREEMSSGAMFSMMSPAYKKPAKRGFWLKVDCELVVYGATGPDAAVSVQGKRIQLRPDGTFTLRFALPDGIQTIDVTAVSADHKEERTITPEVVRTTYLPEPVISE